MHPLTVLLWGLWLVVHVELCGAGIVSGKDLNTGFFWGFGGDV